MKNTAENRYLSIMGWADVLGITITPWQDDFLYKSLLVEPLAVKIPGKIQLNEKRNALTEDNKGKEKIL